MANKKNTKNNTQKNNIPINKKSNQKVVKNTKNNSFIMKTLVFLGIVLFGFIIVYLMYYFFVKESDILINMSTDKQMETIVIEGKENLILTQKYVSDLNYSMRYDVSKFKVFKYKEKDIYKNLEDERVLVVVEKAPLPSNCAAASLNDQYNDCEVTVDNYTQEHYIYNNNSVYKILIKTPGDLTNGIKDRINHMINSFKMSL